MQRAPFGIRMPYIFKKINSERSLSMYLCACERESGWKLLGFSGFKLSFPTINDFCCQPGSTKFLLYFFGFFSPWKLRSQPGATG